METVQVGVVDYPGAQQSAILGLIDLFETAGRLAEERGGSLARLRPLRVDSNALRRAPRSALAAVILPPCLGALPSAEATRPLRVWLLRRHASGTRLCSVCAGAFLLAETGLLDGRGATTHWALADAFTQRFPAVRLDTARLIVDEGDVVTAGGVMAWTDLGLRLIERWLGPAVMLATARMFLVDPAGREQRYYNDFAPRLAHGDAPVLRVQQWLATKYADPVSVPQLAGVAVLGERTFLRRFQAATGQTPSHYLQVLRVTQARELLELSSASVDTVATRVGYEDPSAFRKLFQRVVGLGPGEYRKRFALGRAGSAELARRSLRLAAPGRERPEG